MKRIMLAVAIALALCVGTAACTTQADKANENLSKAAENFEVPRRIIGINAITDKVLFTVEGFCSYETPDNTFEAICKQPDGTITRTTLGMSDNVTFVSVQLEGVKVDTFRSRVIFRPESIIPDFDLSTSGNLSEGKTTTPNTTNVTPSPTASPS